MRENGARWTCRAAPSRSAALPMALTAKLDEWVEEGKLDSVFERICKLLAEQFEPAKEFKPETRLIGDLRADELDVFEFAVGLESEFALELNGREVLEEEVEEFVTVQDAVEFIRAKARGR